MRRAAHPTHSLTRQPSDDIIAPVHMLPLVGGIVVVMVVLIVMRRSRFN
jgi:hypothetical protein